MNDPVSTYRIQFNSECTFRDLAGIIPYLHRLGIATVYASPVFEATPGSVHGYDGVDPNAINPEIGTEVQLRELSTSLRGRGMNWLQDIVPNHMAFHSNNEWFMDVLEKGRQSEFASFFDVSWTGRLYHGRIMVPFLGARLDEVLQNRELSVVVYNGRLMLKYYDSYYPLRPKSYAAVLQAIGVRDEELYARIDSIEDDVHFAEKWEKLRSDILDVVQRRSAGEQQETVFENINSDPVLLRRIADEQFYRLSHWQETDRNINFRRFFIVNSLICLNIHRPEVFRKYHELVQKLVADNVFQGLRIDHIDGLYDPANYLEQLRELVGEDIFIVVEKILEPGESLPPWPVQGSTGYDFLAMVNNLFTDKKNEHAFTAFYRELTGDRKTIHEHLHDKKAHILYRHMSGELENLYQLFMRSELIEPHDYAQIRTEDMKTAIAEFLICCPVYRYYGAQFPLSETEADSVRGIFSRILRSREDLAPAVALLEYVLLEKPKAGNELYNSRVVRFYQRCMQFTGPLMAKGVEDTLMYTWNRYIAHNEVGDSPEAFGCTQQEFHTMMQERRRKWPLSLNATSTHDTKRGEDVRARLHVLSDLPDEWFARVHQWRDMNAPLKTNGAPDANDEYFIYQTLLGAWPMPGVEDNFPERMEQYIEKALREAKTHSDWATPDTGYEDSVKNFIKKLFDTQHPFLHNFSDFHRSICDFGIVNSLAQLILRLTCPGVPDTYQGTELWDLSLVDPDNRRPVDYALRQKFLDELSRNYSPGEVWDDRYSGKIKLWLLHRLLHLRRDHPKLFAEGEYIPLKAEGELADRIFCFVRRRANSSLLVAVPLHMAQICREQRSEPCAVNWNNTHIVLPGTMRGEWTSIVGEKRITGGAMALSELFDPLPFVVLASL